MTFTIQTAHATYSCDANGNIGRPAMQMKPSDQWKVVALVRRCNFGILETIPFADWPTRLPTIQWRFKNGRPRWTLRDLDHGTIREWGSMVEKVYPND